MLLPIPVFESQIDGSHLPYVLALYEQVREQEFNTC